MLLLALNCCSSAANSEGKPDSDNSGTFTETSKVSSVYFNDKKRDTEKIENVLGKIKGIRDTNERIIAITREFIGVPYVGFTLNMPIEEQLYVNTEGMDCTTFVETVMALAMAADRDNPEIKYFLDKLKSIRYRNGEIDGFPSRLHYISDWAIDNAHRGNFKEITFGYDLSEKRVKTIDFMTNNRHLYPAMKEEAIYEAIKASEKPLKNLQYWLIPTSQVEKAAKNYLKSGDIVGIVTNKAGLDVSHVGVLRIEKGIPYLTHASSKYKKVVQDTTPLKDYLQKQKSPGIRVFRLTSP